MLLISSRLPEFSTFGGKFSKIRLCWSSTHSSAREIASRKCSCRIVSGHSKQVAGTVRGRAHPPSSKRGLKGGLRGGLRGHEGSPPFPPLEGEKPLRGGLRGGLKGGLNGALEGA